MERRDDLEVTRMSHFVGIGLVLGFVLPHSSTVFLMVNPLLCVFYQLYKQNQVFYKNNWIVIAPILLTLLINLPQGVSSKAIMSFFAILLYFFCFPMVGKVKIPNVYFYLILGFILLSQVAYAFDIAFMERLLNTYYPLSEEDASGIREQSSISVDNYLNYRLGGLYHNSNDCARTLCFLLVGFLVLKSEKPIRSLLPFIIIAFYAVLLTGSRTGFVVASLAIIAYLFVDKKASVGWRYGVTVLAVLVFMYLIFIGSNTFRGFTVLDMGSTNLKQATFRYYLSTENSVYRILLGYLDTSRFDISGSTSHVMSKFDSDYGSIIFSYGFIGFFCILFYFFTIFRKIDSNGKIFFVLLLWMYSSTIVKSYRALFIFMLLLSIVYSNRKQQIVK